MGEREFQRIRGRKSGVRKKAKMVGRKRVGKDRQKERLGKQTTTFSQAMKLSSSTIAT
jgi:hypothetical protein